MCRLPLLESQQKGRTVPRKLILSSDALDEIDRIAAYIAEVSYNKAMSYEQDLFTGLRQLLTFPESAEKVKIQNRSIRRYVFEGNTIVLYRFDDEAVYIESVHDARSNWQGS